MKSLPLKSWQEKITAKHLKRRRQQSILKKSKVPVQNEKNSHKTNEETKMLNIKTGITEVNGRNIDGLSKNEISQLVLNERSNIDKLKESSDLVFTDHYQDMIKQHEDNIELLLPYLNNHKEENDE